MTPSARAQKGTPPDRLEVECARILPRLALIPEFRPWIQAAQGGDTDFRLLWNCFSLGAPLCTLLELIGTPPDPALGVSVLDHDNESCDPVQFVSSFIRRVRLLEIQGRIPYGEVFHPQDLFNGTFSGFTKVSSPGITFVPNAIPHSG